MNEMSKGYPFIFVMNDRNNTGEQWKYTLQYRFKSSKSNHTYIVRIESYEQHVYCVKFFDKSTIGSKRKYSIRSNTFEPRTIFYTIYHIMIDVLRKDSLASFFFIGAEDEKDIDCKSTRRYNIYRRFVASVISENLFEHYRVNDLSLYMLINRKSVVDTAYLANQIERIVNPQY